MTTEDSPISKRIRELSESVTLVITAKAKAMRAAGEDVIGFGAGEPDFPTPEHVVEAAQRACADPANHGYTPGAGLPELREAIATATSRDSGRPTQANEVVVANGGKHALYSIFQTLVDPGDEVLLPTPYWVSYPEQIQLAGGRVVEVAATADKDWRVTVDQLEAARTARTKLLVFTSPSNPTGAVYPPDEVERIGRWAADTGLWVVTDEIYEHLVYGDARHSSMPGVVPELRPRCVIANGVAKTYAMTGWRVGWSVAPVEVAGALTRLQSHSTSNVSNVAQRAALAALEGPRESVEHMHATYDRRRRIAHARLSEIEGVECPLPEGAFYAFPSVQKLLERHGIGSSLELCDWLLDKAQVALVPGEGFGAPGCIRLSYALSDHDLERGLDRIAEALA